MRMVRGLAALVSPGRRSDRPALAKGKVKVIAETYKLDDIGRAYDRVANGQGRFRAALTV